MPDAFEAIAVWLSFYTRLPLAVSGKLAGAPDFMNAGRSLPLAGAMIGVAGGIVVLAARVMGLSPLVAATLSVGFLALLTGGLHEDGVADVADGFGGGRDRERKLEIMRDSRVGSYGALSLVLAVVIRIAASSAIVAHAALFVLFSLACVGAVSRLAGLLPMLLTAPARNDGLGASARGPSAETFIIGASICFLFGCGALMGGAGIFQVVMAIAASFAAAWSVAQLAQRQIGGYTGDVLGAAQQAAEIAALIVFSAG